jgi:hypothetical protein
MKVSTLALVTLITLSFISCQDYNSGRYIKQSADEKMTDLWGEITADKTPGEWFGLHTLTGLAGLDLHPTFEHEGDVFPEGREKLIHTVGVVAMAEFISVEGNPYSGILGSGCQNVLLRLSTAKPYKTKDSSPEAALYNFVPGISVKFLVDKKPSVNTVAMYSTSGQPSWNFFEHDFSPQFDINYKQMAFGEKVVAAKFNQISYYVSTLGNKEMCSVTQDGAEVDESDIKFPFKLIFRAPNAVKKSMSKKYDEDYIKVAKGFKIGTTIYSVYASGSPNCIEEYIGEIRLTSRFTTSTFADTRLFFKHPSNEPDFADQPDWQKHRDFWSLTEKTPAADVKRGKCPFESLLSLF